MFVAQNLTNFATFLMLLINGFSVEFLQTNADERLFEFKRNHYRLNSFRGLIKQ